MITGRPGGGDVALVDFSRHRTAHRIVDEARHLDVWGQRDLGLEHDARLYAAVGQDRGPAAKGLLAAGHPVT
jgi:hypothetical protein